MIGEAEDKPPPGRLLFFAGQSELPMPYALRRRRMPVCYALVNALSLISYSAALWGWGALVARPSVRLA